METHEFTIMHSLQKQKQKQNLNNLKETRKYRNELLKSDTERGLL